jgi:chromosome segregation ATPase
MARTKTTQRKSTGPQGVPRHQLASRHEGSSSGSNDPIGELEARVDRLRSELRHGCSEHARDSRRIAELSAEVNRLQYKISERDTTIDWAITSRSFAWDCEAKALARVAELSASLENLQAYCNTLHEEVHVLYDQLHPNVPPNVAAMGAGPSKTANGGSDGGIDLFWSPSFHESCR